MNDVQTRRPIHVSTDGTGGPYIMAPVDQLGQIRELLVRNAVEHWVEPNAISLDGEPAIVVINLGLAGDAGRVQTILDGAR
jgi:hypothetical protein